MSSNVTFPSLTDASLGHSSCTGSEPAGPQADAQRPGPHAPDCLVHNTVVVDFPASIGAGTEIGPFSHVAKGAEIGQNCRLGQNVHVASMAIVGSNVRLEGNVRVAGGATLEDDVYCGPGAVVGGPARPRAQLNRQLEPQPCRVARGATLGAGAVLLGGRTVGRYAMVGAGAVVTHDVLPYESVGGVPARRIGWLCRCGEGKLDFTGKRVACCPACGQQYRLDGPHGPKESSPDEERRRRKAELRAQERRYVESITPSRAPSRRLSTQPAPDATQDQSQ